jgi:1-acyl-sn-glycerol-3-phosphate acyltransferase
MNSKVIRVLVSIIRTLLIVILTLVISTIDSLFGIFDRKSLLHGFFMRLWSRGFLWITGVKVGVKGLENLKDVNPAIIVANHESALDIPVLAANLPVQIRFMAKKNLFLIPFLGWSLKLGGNVPIDRKNRRRAIDSIDRFADKIFSKGYNLAVFPEGTRSVDGTVGNFKKGAFRLAKQYSVPLIPATILGTRYCIPRKRKLIKPGNVELIIGSPINPSDYENFTELVNFARYEIVENKRKYESKRKVRFD